MPRLVLPLAMATLLLAAIVPAQAQGLPDPLGLRGFNLGMTLADVRKLPHPDKPAGKIELICTGDKLSDEADVSYPAGSTSHEIGIKMCGYLPSLRARYAGCR
jgi:hypothetical protein